MTLPSELRLITLFFWALSYAHARVGQKRSEGSTQRSLWAPILGGPKETETEFPGSFPSTSTTVWDSNMPSSMPSDSLAPSTSPSSRPSSSPSIWPSSSPSESSRPSHAPSETPRELGSVHKLTSPDSEGGQFGSSIAISGNTMVVGSMGENTIGAAYVYEKNIGSGQWIQTDRLIPDDGMAWDYFGNSVAIAGNRIVVGAVGVGSGKGAVYLFVNDGSKWIQKDVKRGDISRGYFGDTVAIDAEGYTAIGASGHGIFTKGSFHTYSYQPTTETLHSTVQSIIATSKNTGFGKSVTTDGGVTVVGAYKEDGTGVIHIYEGGHELTITGAEVDDRFGYSVAVSGGTLVVGAPGHRTKGAAYVYEKDATSNWEMVAMFTTDKAIEFGTHVAVSGNTVTVGTGGKIFIYQKSDENGSSFLELQSEEVIVSPVDVESLAISGDSLAFGSPYDDNGRGSIYIYEWDW